MANTFVLFIFLEEKGNHFLEGTYEHLKQLDSSILRDRKAAIILPAFQLKGELLTQVKKMEHYTIDVYV